MRYADVRHSPHGVNETSWTYNGLDCLVTFEVFEALEKQIEEDANIKKTYETALAKQAPIMEMELRGIKIDEIRRSTTRKSLEKDIERVKVNLDKLTTAMADIVINPNSPAQVGDFLYRRMRLPVQRARNAKGDWVPSSGIKALEKLKSHFYAQPIINHILTLRDLTKQLSFLNTGIDEDGRFRCSLNVAGTKTGRLASSFSDFGTGKNLQNVDRRLRYPFIADRGCMFLNIDLEQADSRNVGARCWQLFSETHGREFAGAYLDACESGDLHTTVAKMVWPELAWGTASDKEIAGVLYYRQDSYRQTAKKNGHASNYLSTPRTLAGETNTPEAIVKKFQERYFAAFPCVTAWNNWVIEQIISEGKLTTMFGRVREFHGRRKDRATHRDACAFEPQSMTAHEIDMGYLQIWRKYPWVELLLQVHDSILMQIPILAEDKIPAICETMKVYLSLASGREFYVPVDWKSGLNWGDYDEEKNPNGLRSPQN